MTGELNTIATPVKDCLDQQTTPETTAVLVQDRVQRERVLRASVSVGRRCPAVDREQPSPGKPLVMTMHQATGMDTWPPLGPETSSP
ncbi:MAG: hypothetical protein OJJ54_21560 [Pseudonocardia sp.]|nr:hypothetical protein [Pseudonocardia sp.]